jgi:hypothetical protein
MRGANFYGWLCALPLVLTSCIGQDSWYRWANVHPHPELAPMHRMRLVVEDSWESLGSVQSDDYRNALVATLTQRGVVLDDDASNVDATILVRTWFHHPRGRGRGSAPGNSSAGVDIRIDRAADRQRVFSGRFIGGPAAAAQAVADLVVLGRVDET